MTPFFWLYKNNWLKTKNTIQLKKVIKGETMLFNSLEKTYQAKVILLNNKWKELYNYDMGRIKKQKKFCRRRFYRT